MTGDDAQEFDRDALTSALSDDEFDAALMEDLGVQSLSIDTQSYAKRAAEAFAEYVIGEAAHTVTVDEFGTDAVVDCIQQLADAGYRVSDRTDEHGEPGFGFVHPGLFKTLEAEYQEYNRLGGRDLSGLKQVGVYGVDVWSDESMPEDTGVVLHPDAVAPRPPRLAYGPPAGRLEAALDPRAWLVRDPAGVVVVERESDE